jgi:Uma2 family endonuclease
LDKGEKRRAYQQLASLKEYLLVALDAPHVTLYRRQGERWDRKDYGDPQAIVPLEAINSQLLMREIYQGVIFD